MSLLFQVGIFKGSMLVPWVIHSLPSNSFVVFCGFGRHVSDLQMVLLLLVLKQKLNACCTVGPWEKPAHKNSATRIGNKSKQNCFKKKCSRKKILEIVVGSQHWWTTFRTLLHCIWVDFIYKSHAVAKAHSTNKTHVPKKHKMLRLCHPLQSNLIVMRFHHRFLHIHQQ